MKKALSLALAIILTLSLIVPIYAFDANDSPSPGDEALKTEGSGIVAATAPAIPPTKEELFAGYTLKDGLDKALYDKNQVISIEYVDHVFHHETGDRIDIPYCLKVTGTFGEKSVFGDDIFWSVYLPPADQFKGRFYQRLYPFNTSEVPYELPFTFSNGGYQVEYYELFKLNGSAIAADIGRTIAKNYYKYNGYIYGYAHGASGGSTAAIQMIEDKTYNVWDGGIAIVMTMPTTLSFNMGTGSDPIDGFKIVALRHRAEQIWDAMRPGGSGDPYAGLEDWERAALEEIERYGVPWISWSGINASSQPFLFYNIIPAPPNIPDLESYVADFWSKPGYLGTEQSELGDWWRKLRADGTFTDEVLAQAAFHRHRNIDPALNVFTFDHLSQYPKIGDPVTSTSYTGNVQRKSMIIQSMEDGGAINWYADWYYQRVKDAGKQDMCRLYFNENAGHMGYTTDPNTVEYQGIVEQALADLAAWVEDGVEPAASTGFDRVRSQPVLKKGAAARQGYQPTIDFTVNGAERLIVTTGEAAHFVAEIECPPKGGTVTSVEWDFLGNGNYVKSSFSPAPDGTVTVQENYTYTGLGTYFPRVRVTAHRDGIADTRIRFLQNIGRARVVFADAAEIVAADKAALQIGYATGDSASCVTGNLTLPLVGTSGASVAWVSDTPGTVTAVGTVTRPGSGSPDETVKLTATITKGSASDTKEFLLVVKALPTAEALLAGYVKMTGLSQDGPKILSIESGSTPSPHVKVSGCFGTGTTATWSIYLPSASQFDGRFYQRVYPFDTGTIQTDLEFSFASGAYQVEHYSLGNLQSTATTAHLSRTIAKNYYGYNDPIYGYAFGGSGGSFQMIGIIEGKIPQVFDGAVPYVMCIPPTMAITRITSFMKIVLGAKGQQIFDAVSPGGSGDPYAGLTNMERSALEEIVKLGVPWSSWASITPGTVSAVDASTLPAGYVTAFWSQPGYLGTENSELGKLFRSLRDAGAYSEATLASAAYHRYSDPGPTYYMWDHLRGKYPQYSTNPPNDGMGTASFLSGGAEYNGDINCKVIEIQNKMDGGAYPVNADWYKQRVIASGKEADFRIYINDNAGHLDTVTAESPIGVQYLGILEQALRDMAAWVEDGVEPAQSTSYTMVNSQVVLAADAATRQGIQPVVDLTVNGAERAGIIPGQTVSLAANVQLPPKGGQIVRLEWDLLGDGNYVESSFSTLPDGTVTAQESYTYTTSGTYFPKVRITSNRDGRSDTRVASVQNLDRARVVVENNNNNNNNSSSTSGSSNGTATGSRTEVVTNNGSIKIVADPIVDTSGTATVKIDASTLDNAKEKARVDENGVKTTVIEVKKGQGADEYKVELPVGEISGGSSKEVLEVQTEFATLDVPANMLQAEFAKGLSDVALSIAKADTSTLPADIKNQIGDKPVIELTLTSGNTQIEWNNPDVPVTVSIDYTPTAEELKNPDNIVIWYIDGSGKAISVPNAKYDAKTGKVVFTTTHFSMYALAYVTKTFSDAGKFSWAKKQIEVLASKGIIDSTETTYKPETSISRGEFIAMLVKSLGLSAKIDGNFADVKTGHKYYQEIAIAKKLGITNGVGNNKFDPEKPILRQDMFGLTEKALSIRGKLNGKGSVADLKKFSDESQIAASKKQSIANLLKAGIISGSGKTINPKEYGTKAHAAVIVYNIIKY